MTTKRTRATIAACGLAVLLAGCNASTSPDAAGRHDGTSPSTSPAAAPPTPPAGPLSPDADPRTPITSGKTGRPRGLPADVTTTGASRKNATTVAQNFVYLIDNWDTAIDNSPADAGRRAIPLVTADLGHGLAVAPKANVGEAWTQLAVHHGWTTVVEQLGGLGPQPADTDTTGVRAVTATMTGHGTAGWTSSTGSSQTLLITLSRSKPGTAWTVDSYSYI